MSGGSRAPASPSKRHDRDRASYTGGPSFSRRIEMRVLLSVAAMTLVCAAPAGAQAPDANVYTGEAHQQYQYIQGLVLKAADKVGEDLYASKPTPAVRSLRAVLGHIADANMLLCGAASGKPTDFDAIMKDPVVGAGAREEDLESGADRGAQR